MSFFRKLEEFLLDFDHYGYKIGVHYKGKTSYNTWLGFLCTALVYGIVLQSIVILGTAYFNDSRQEEKVNVEKFDRFGSDQFHLNDNGIKIYLYSVVSSWQRHDETGHLQGVHFETMRPEVGRF
mgnify:CR=1 FL=1